MQNKLSENGTPIRELSHVLGVEIKQRGGGYVFQLFFKIDLRSAK